MKVLALVVMVITSFILGVAYQAEKCSIKSMQSHTALIYASIHEKEAYDAMIKGLIASYRSSKDLQKCSVRTRLELDELFKNGQQISE